MAGPVRQATESLANYKCTKIFHGIDNEPLFVLHVIQASFALLARKWNSAVPKRYL